MTTTTPTTAPTAGYQRRPLRALAKAEYLQFRRNRTLLTMGILFPIAIPLTTFFVGSRNGDATASLVSTTLEIFALMALMFVQYYSVLSMVTTRRSEGVLKRLRTGEAADWQLKAAPVVPGALLTLVGSVGVGVVVFGFGGPAPVNVVAILLALVGGIIVFSLLALATSGLTKNAEAAQITSLPVMTVAMVGLASLRGFMPDGLSDIVGWTPFAAVSDLISLGARGTLATAPASDSALDFVGTFADFGRPVVTLVLWTVAAIALTRGTFRWDDRG